ncbi:Transcription initiation factor TFIID subunit 2 [Echinococcus granulosus]|nr:Transcription initiation factor TFIID subunit 2 [Echinococcus granulosus]
MAGSKPICKECNYEIILSNGLWCCECVKTQIFNAVFCSSFVVYSPLCTPADSFRMNQTILLTKTSLTKRPFRLAHQTLCLSKIDFSQCIVVGFTQLVIWPLETSLRRIPLNVRQCRIHRVVVEAAEEYFRGPSDIYSRIYPPVDVPVAFSDPCVEICKQDCKFRTLDNFEIKHASIISTTDPDEGGGELTVRIPPSILGLVRDKQPLLVTIEFSLTRPKYGFHFVIPEDGSLDTAYAFTGGPPNSSRSWFPCVDCSEPCTWKIEITVDEDFVAIAPGELLGPPEYTDDLRAKTYQFFLAQPTSAPSIGLVIGAFEIFPDISESTGSTVITHFCPKGLRSLLVHSSQSLAGIVEYYEGELASQFPFHSLDFVFVDRAFEDHQSFASVIIFSVDLLYSPRIIDQAITSRRIFAFAVAQQFFGCALQAETWAGAWLPYGIAGYLAGLYQKRVFGNNEYRYFIANEMRSVTGYEHTRHGIILDPSNTIRKNTYFSLKHPQVLSPDYLSVYIKKSHLVIRMLGLRFGQRVLLQVFNKLFVLARLSTINAGAEEKVPVNGTPVPHDNSVTTVSEDSAVPPTLSDENRANLLLSTDSFRRIISTVTGQDIENFLDHWVFKPGHVRLFAKFLFNRKRNVVELELKQDLQSRSTLNYTGPLTAMLQELDGPFIHTFKLEEGRTSKDLQCHSKSRKHKKKKIPLSNGDEVEMDLSRIYPDSPLLWLRLDPDLTVIRSIHTEQADFAWHLMLAYDRDCLGQLEAVHALVDFVSPETRHALSNIVADEQVYYRVRTDACFVLCRVANELASIGAGGVGLGLSAGGGGVGGSSSHHTHQTSSVLIPLFWQLYSSPLTRGLVRQNDFSNLQRYFLQKAIVRAVATLRIQQVCPWDVLNFLVELNRYNDNSRNAYSDCYYRAELINAMKDTLTPAIVMRGVISVSSLPNEVRTVVEEVARCLNRDAQIPSYKRMVTVACLLAIRRLQRFGFLPVDPKLFYKAAASGHYTDVRLAAIECLVDYVRGERDQTALEWLFDQIIEQKGTTEASYSRLRYETVRLLTETPPFARGETGSRLDTPQLVDRIWSLMNHGCAGDSRLRCALTDLYFSLYGNRRPSCLPLADGVLLVRVREGRSMVRLPEKEGSMDGDRADGNESGLLESTGRPQLENCSPLKRRMEHLSDDDDEYIPCINLHDQE